jgi:hypothetical protein
LPKLSSKHPLWDADGYFFLNQKDLESKTVLHKKIAIYILHCAICIDIAPVSILQPTDDVLEAI